MQRRLTCAAVVGAALACTALVFGRAAPAALPPCNLGQIVKLSDPVLSAPSPAYPGSTITSSAGSWSSCGASFTGFYKEWLRDGVVVSGPTWVASTPGSFAYVAQSADVGHSLTSAVQPCIADGCYGSYAQSSNAVVPSATPPVVADGYLRDASGVAVSGATVQLFRDADTDTSVSQSAIDTTTTDASGYYVLRAANTGDVAADVAANDGWVNFAIEATVGDTPYFDVEARRWNSGNGTWLASDQVVAGASSDGSSTTPSDDLSVDLAPSTGGSVAAGDGPNVVGTCKLAIEKTTLVRTEVDPTIIGELHVAKDATGTFRYGVGHRADSQIAIGIGVGGHWHLGGYKHIATSSTVTVGISNTGDDWAHQIRSRFQYGLYKHERSTVDWVTGRPILCGTSYTKEARLWTGNIEVGPDLSGKLHQCLTKYSRWALPYPKNGLFHRYDHKLQTWEGAANVDLGMGALQLRAWSGASSSVGYDYQFGIAYDQHWLCGTDAYPAYASRIFAGG